MSRRRIALGGALLMTLIFAGGALAADPIVVRPADMDGWAFQTDLTATAEMVVGPGTPPLGAGSAELRVGADGDSGAQLRNVDYAGTRLEDVTALEYSTFVQQDGLGGQVPYLMLNIDNDNNGTVDDLLFFEPVYQTGAYSGDPILPQPAPVVGQWQTWNARAGGWWSLNALTFGPPLVTLDTYVLLNPDATIVNASNGAGGVRIVAGFGAGAWDNFVGNADAFTIGVNGSDTTYDFERSLPTPPSKNACKKGGWQDYARQDGSEFKNQGDCIQYANTNK